MQHSSLECVCCSCVEVLLKMEQSGNGEVKIGCFVAFTLLAGKFHYDWSKRLYLTGLESEQIMKVPN